MSERYGVRWGRAALSSLLGLAAVAAFGSQVWSGSVSALGGPSLVLQGTPSQFNTAKLSTVNVGIGMVPINVRTSAGTTQKQVLRMGFAQGTLDGFCISQTQAFLGLDYTIRITSRDNVVNMSDIRGKNVQFDVTYATSTSSPNTSGNGIALRGNVDLGVATQSITTWKDAGGVDVVNPLDGPESYAGVNGRLFGIDSDVGDLYNLKGDVYDAVIEGPLEIDDLKIEVLPGGSATLGCRNIPIVY